MSVPSHEELQELLGAYALDAVDPDERELLEEHLATCPRCRAEVNQHRETAALLAFAGQPAPEGVWGRIAANLEEPPPPIDLGLARASKGVRGRRRWPLGVVAAAAVVISVLSLGVALRDGDGGRSSLPEEVASAPRVRLTSSDGQHSADIVVINGQGYVFNDNLPALDESKVYQLWGRDGTVLVSLGLLGPDPEQETFNASGEFEAFAITAEDWPGVVQSQQRPVVAGVVA